MVRNGRALKEGKLSPELLERLLAYTSTSPEILIGAQPGEDAAVVKGASKVVLTSDPITFTEEEIGSYAVAVNNNDIVAMGGIPVYFTTTILVPPYTSQERLELVFNELHFAAVQAGILWIGGHTEVTSAVNRIIVAGHAVGFLERQPTPSSSAKPGEKIVMTKWAALEGTTIIAKTKPTETKTLLGHTGYSRVLNWLRNPGISIVREGRLMESQQISAGHDPTEGGLATGVQEIAKRSRVGVKIDRDKILLRVETSKLCQHFRLDPLGLLSSGVYLFTAPIAEANRAIEILMRHNIPAACIGTVTDEENKLVMKQEGKTIPLPSFERDEIIKLT